MEQYKVKANQTNRLSEENQKMKETIEQLSTDLSHREELARLLREEHELDKSVEPSPQEVEKIADLEAALTSLEGILEETRKECDQTKSRLQQKEIELAARVTEVKGVRSKLEKKK
jgi:ABC-type oligopeptide transport system substrate-binding subunit